MMKCCIAFSRSDGCGELRYTHQNPYPAAPGGARGLVLLATRGYPFCAGSGVFVQNALSVQSLPEVMDDLISMLDDPDARVRCSALHTLSCDQCKEGAVSPRRGKSSASGGCSYRKRSGSACASPCHRTGRTMGSYECHGQSGSVDRDGDRPKPRGA
jgi:hypothetical protein